MLHIAIPGHGDLHLEHLVLDYNGTLAEDGRLISGVASRICFLAEHLTVHVITADTYGGAAQELNGLPVQLQLIGAGDQAAQKEALVQRLGADRCCAIGNGANDVRMLDRAILGVCIMGREGAAAKTLVAADIVIGDPVSALDLLLQPNRLKATLRV